MLDEIRPADTFRVIVFGSEAHQLQRRPVAPTADNLARARAFLRNLNTMGGTEIELGIEAALSPDPDGDRMRMVVFLTDGFIGSEASVMATIKRYRGAARIFAFGIGGSVNRWLIEEMALAGAGVGRVVGLQDDLPEVVESFAERLRTPYFTDAWIDWGNLAVTDVTPAGTFDLYAGSPVRVMGRWPAGAKAKRATLVGRVGADEVRIAFSLRRGGEGAGAIPVLWARAQIARRVRALATPHRSSADSAEHARLVEEITQLGLTYGITTRWTAFVAVAQRQLDVPAEPVEVAVGQLMIDPAPSSGGFAGSSTPEPAEWAAMLLLFALGAAYLRRHRA